jgi:hypothetical protein
MSFYEPLRQALADYAHGVHVAGPPAREADLRRLQDQVPPAYLDFLRSFDGVSLFHELILLLPAGDPELASPHPGFTRIGEGAAGALWMDQAGRVRLVDESQPDPIVYGSDMERWLDAVLAREGLIIDKEGEFREVLDEEGEPTPAVRRKRARAGRKRDPGSSFYLLEEAELEVEEHAPERALLLLRQAVEIDPQAGPAWELLAGLLGRGPEAAAAWGRAAEVTLDPGLRATRQSLRIRQALRVVSP